MSNDKRKRNWLIFFSCCLLFLLSACSTPSSNPPSSQAAGTHLVGVITPTPTTAPTTVPMPVTQTSCPATGTARAMVTAPLVLGSHPTIIYTVYQNTPRMATLKRYDVTTGSKTVLVSIPNVIIDRAQISTDGQWVLFISRSNPSATNQSGPESDKLQAIRMDGQGLQTLYCTTTEYVYSWSPDQQSIAIETDGTDNPNNASAVQLLHASTGQLQTLFTNTDNGQYNSGPGVDFWADNTHLYVSTRNWGGVNTIYLVDIAKGNNQQISNFTPILKDTFSSFTGDGKKLYIDQNGCDQSGCAPPSTVSVMPATGGTAQTIWQSTQYNVTQACPLNDHQLLIAIVNLPLPLGSGDSSHNGIWIMNSDGTLGQRLTMSVQGESPSLGFCLTPSLHASRDGSIYAIDSTDTPQRQLIFGKANGGTPTPFATFGNGLGGGLVGWTTM